MAELLDYNLDEAKSLTTLADGEEVRLRITYFEKKNSKKGKPMLAMVLEPVEIADASAIFHNIMLPAEGMEPRQFNQTLLRLKAFVENFKLPWPLDPEEERNEEGYAIVGEEEDEEYGKRNTIKRWSGSLR